MSIYRRLAKINCNLAQKKIPKSGYNKHGKFKYYELEDMIHPCNSECFNENIALIFPYAEDVAILKLVDFDDPSKYITYRIKMPEIVVREKNPNNQMIQDLGADVTYLQRYLLKLAFPCFTDKDVVDMDFSESSGEDASSAQETQSNAKSVDINVPQLIVEAEQKLQQKGVEITPKSIKNQVRTLRKYSVDERRAINEYFKKEGL